ncbi:hypothetical protein E3P96_02253 [Wallemia ichthyophaga]|nr:hypothetical protein E3P96_02253 [Wallemia ichthyophaga]
MSEWGVIDQEIDKRGLIVQAILGDRCKHVLGVSKSLVELDRGLHRAQRVIDSIRSVDCSVRPRTPPPSTSIDPIPALVKLVHDSTENIWRFMENDQHLHSAWLYSLARITHIQLSTNYPETLNQLVILKSQYESTVQLKQQIVLKGVISLIKQSISYQDALRTLTGLILLDSPTYNQSLDRLLQQRSVALNHIQNNLSPVTVISQSLQLINESHDLVYKLYIEEGLSNFIHQCSENTADITTKSLIDQLSGSEIITHRIPNQLLNYTPYFAPLEKLSTEFITGSLSKWTDFSLGSLRTVLDPHSGLLSTVKSIPDLCPLRAIVEITNIPTVKDFFVGLLEERCQILWIDLHSNFLETTLTKINKAINTVTHIPNSKNDPITNLLSPLPNDINIATFTTKRISIVSDILQIISNQAATIHHQVVDFVVAPDTTLQSEGLLGVYREHAKAMLDGFVERLTNTFDKLVSNEHQTQRKRQLMVLRQLLDSLSEEEGIAKNITLSDTLHVNYDNLIHKVTKKWAADVVDEHLKADTFEWTECELDGDESRWETLHVDEEDTKMFKIPRGPSSQLFELLYTIAHDVSNISLHVRDKRSILYQVLSNLSQRTSTIFTQQEHDGRANTRKAFDVAFLAVLCGYSGVEVDVRVEEEARAAMMDAATNSLKKFQLMLGALIDAPEKPSLDSSGGASGVGSKPNPLLRLGPPEMKVDLNSMIVPTVNLKPRINLLAL